MGKFSKGGSKQKKTDKKGSKKEGKIEEKEETREGKGKARGKNLLKKKEIEKGGNIFFPL